LEAALTQQGRASFPSLFFYLKMRSRIWLILWIIGILFPMAFLGKI